MLLTVPATALLSLASTMSASAAVVPAGCSSYFCSRNVQVVPCVRSVAINADERLYMRATIVITYSDRYYVRAAKPGGYSYVFNTKTRTVRNAAGEGGPRGAIRILARNQTATRVTYIGTYSWFVGKSKFSCGFSFRG